MKQYRKSPRAPFLDYNVGMYFITICTKNRQHFFGEIYNERMHLSKIGKFLESQLSSAHYFCANVEVPLFVVMPNHIHLIVSITDAGTSADVDSDNLRRSPNPYLRDDAKCKRFSPALSRYINSIKGTVTKFAKTNDIEFGWQPRYHDHAIRSTRDCNNISDYILNNVIRWGMDEYNDPEK